MQAVILCAGKGTRMGGLTTETPKPLLISHGKTLLHHKLDTLPVSVDEVIIVVGYLRDMIQSTIGNEYAHRKITYIEQPLLNGTAGALWSVRDILHDQFIVAMGDDIYDKKDFERATRLKDWVLFVDEIAHMQGGGRIVTNESGSITNIIESNDHGAIRGLISTNLFLLDTRIFEYPMIPKATGSDEYGLPQTVLSASKQGAHIFTSEHVTSWKQITNPEDLV